MTTTPHTQAEADTQLAKAIEIAAKSGRPIAPDSPLGRAASRAVERQQAGKASFSDSFSKEIDTTMQELQRLQVESGREAARNDRRPPVPGNPAADLTRATLAGVGVIDLSDHASTIGSDVQDGEFIEKFTAAERARALMLDPAFEPAMAKARAEAARHGRQPTARDVSKALQEVRAEQGPQPVRPPEPVTALFSNSTAAKSTSSASHSVVPDRFSSGGPR